MSEAGAKPPLCRLYLLTPERIEASDFAERLAAALDGGDVACVQLRLKDVGEDAIEDAARVLAPIAQSRDVAFIMNDRPDLAKPEPENDLFAQLREFEAAPSEIEFYELFSGE